MPPPTNISIGQTWRDTSSGELLTLDDFGRDNVTLSNQKEYHRRTLVNTPENFQLEFVSDSPPAPEVNVGKIFEKDGKHWQVIYFNSIGINKNYWTLKELGTNHSLLHANQESLLNGTFAIPMPSSVRVGQMWEDLGSVFKVSNGIASFVKEGGIQTEKPINKLLSGKDAVFLNDITTPPTPDNPARKKNYISNLNPGDTFVCKSNTAVGQSGDIITVSIKEQYNDNSRSFLIKNQNAKTHRTSIVSETGILNLINSGAIEAKAPLDFTELGINNTITQLQDTLTDLFGVPAKKVAAKEPNIIPGQYYTHHINKGEWFVETIATSYSLGSSKTVVTLVDTNQGIHKYKLYVSEEELLRDYTLQKPTPTMLSAPYPLPTDKVSFKDLATEFNVSELDTHAYAILFGLSKADPAAPKELTAAEATKFRTCYKHYKLILSTFEVDSLKQTAADTYLLNITKSSFSTSIKLYALALLLKKSEDKVIKIADELFGKAHWWSDTLNPDQCELINSWFQTLDNHTIELTIPTNSGTNSGNLTIKDGYGETKITIGPTGFGINGGALTFNPVPLNMGGIAFTTTSFPLIAQPKQSETPMNKQDVANKVLGMLRPKDVVFGGFVRDKLAGKEFQDIDILLEVDGVGNGDYHVKNDFIDQLKKTFGADAVSYGRNEILYNGSGSERGKGVNAQLRKREVSILDKDKNVIVKLDLITNRLNNPFTSLDFDINGLWQQGSEALKEDGLINAAPGLDVQAVRKHIEERTFTVVGKKESKPLQRITKMKARGFHAWAKPGDKIVLHSDACLWSNFSFNTNKSLADTYGDNTAFEVIDSNVTQGVCLAISRDFGGHSNHNGRRSETGIWVGNTAIKEVISKVQKQLQKGEKKMSEKSVVSSGSKGDFVSMVKDDAMEAAYRVAAKQMSHAIRLAAVKLIRGRLESKKLKKSVINTQISGVEAFLDSEIGEALIAGAIGYGLTYTPHIKDDPRAKTLAKEFRVSGMTTIGNELVGLAVSNFLPILTDALQALPEPPKVRIAATASPEQVVASNEIEAETEHVAHEQAVATVEPKRVQ